MNINLATFKNVLNFKVVGQTSWSHGFFCVCVLSALHDTCGQYLALSKGFTLSDLTRLGRWSEISEFYGAASCE